MKALVLAPLAAEALHELKQHLPVSYESWVDSRRLADPMELAQRINREGFSILVVEADFLPQEVFEQAASLRLLAVCRSSLAHVDLAAATKHGVAVVNAPGRNAQAVAELTVGMMLMLARGIHRLDAYVKEGRWRSPVEPYLTMSPQDGELAGKTLGILGLGQVGSRVARLAHAFDMRVLAYDPYRRHPGGPGAAAPASPSLGAASEAGQCPVPLLPTITALATQADYITVHVPGSPDTQGLLGRSVLAGLKPGCRIINTSAYHVVDEAALVEALRTGRVAGAAFDVFQTHPIPPNSPLLRLDNVVLTPHIGGATRETVARHSRMIVEDIVLFLHGRMPRRLVNPEVWHSRG